jgi:potassium-dependent mechanosensitive channel
LLLVALVSLLLSLGAAAQMPKAVPGVKQQQDAGTPAAQAPLQKSLEERIETARTRIGEVKTRRQVFDDSGYVPPAGITPRELDNVRTYGDRLVMFSESALRSLEAQQQLEAELRAVEATAAAWQGFEEKPPYSVLLADDLGEQLAVQGKRLESVQSRITASEALIEEFRVARAEADLNARAAAEKSEAGRARQAAEWRWRAAVLHVEAIESFIAWSIAELGRVKVERALIEARMNLVQRQRTTARSKLRFTQADLDEAKSRLDRQIAPLEMNFKAVAAENMRLGKELVTAQQALVDARRAAAGGEPVAVAALETAMDRLRVINAQSDSARTRGEILTLQLASLNEMKSAWADRFVLVNGESALGRQEASRRLRSILERAASLMTNGQADAASFQAEEEISAERLAALDETSEEAARERAVLGAVRDKLRVAARHQRTIEAGVQSVERWLEEAQVGQGGEAVKERVRRRGADATLLLKKLWEFELFSVDDTIEIAGEMVAVARPVTVRKVVTIGLWVMFGLWVSTFLTRYAHRTLIEHYQVGPAQAQVLRRWMTATNVLVLLLIGLYLVRIPLTAFAFLGGALAIGFGFGTQTLIKNLVSGVLMLLERQIRAGDIVQIEGIVGTVMAVDVRSTRVLNFDGKETVIPNSVFLESNVTNWTLGSRQIRLSIEVSVAYSSPTRLVAELLVGCAQAHDRVLKEPAPFVFLKAFGESALVFELYFWVEVGGNGIGAAVASDLRFLIERALAEHGIVIPLAQRDLHFSQAAPIRVSMEPPADA